MEMLKNIFLFIGMLAVCWVGFVVLLTILIHKRWFPFHNHSLPPQERRFFENMTQEEEDVSRN